SAERGHDRGADGTGGMQDCGIARRTLREFLELTAGYSILTQRTAKAVLCVLKWKTVVKNPN
ncbi:MAG: hypothetical protein J6C52_05975, partial [Clostridia bacterium]|nr:hypothetical protein [Clostridia bacterium]